MLAYVFYPIGILWMMMSGLKADTVAKATDTIHTRATIRLYTPYTKISVHPGQSITYNVDVTNNSKVTQNVDLWVTGLSPAWNYSLKSGSWDIRQIAVLPGQKESVTLQVTVPLRINKGAYRFYLHAGNGTTLPLTVIVAERGIYKTAFTTDQPNLEGAANSTFTFNTTLQNATADTQLYALNAEVPPGWDLAFKANGYKQVASILVNPNSTQNLTIEVHPPDQVPAGKYRIPVIASSGSTGAELDLEVVITGNYGMSLSTPSGLLSTDVTAGSEKSLKLTVTNTGSASLKKIQFSATTPTNWDVTFDPKTIDELPAGKTAEVKALIKSDKHAIAGDYLVTIRANTTETSAKADFRVTVKTPVLWGWLGILIILVALGSIYYLFRKYGRR
ncbi:COG1470 family protein [Thermoflavifilum thermophilum]|uniref:NPCBM-associated, NEW3 domain of alpha-galactosidase n=1 Tax=Thermoflavifilum thermophilum TaxID=1393122 RepID=A0A1I7MZQ5_9BACT|nr:NEW3 domain-containing protein [Thermoflavifilum thermophilum]SFV27806.1 NPCBM-associated, NEW3 domain of alpha-galactosidase [Thermoflavifilum thermophilum]